jgi:hypothetical protein
VGEVAGVDREVGQVGEPRDLPQALHVRRRDGPERAEVDRLGADRAQVGVDEPGVAQLVPGDIDRIERTAG